MEIECLLCEIHLTVVFRVFSFPLLFHHIVPVTYGKKDKAKQYQNQSILTFYNVEPQRNVYGFLQNILS